MDQQVAIIVGAVVIVLVAIAGIWIWMRARRRAHLRTRFGPEYDRALREHRDVNRAEAALSARERRVERLEIRRLSREESARFSESWRRVQARFVDDPALAVADADRLVTELLNARGYPMAEFEQRASDISVDHPRVVEHYRAAHAIAERRERGEASTEDLRQALVHFRQLFDDLLEVTEPRMQRRAG